jgi:hypothetical protein
MSHSGKRLRQTAKRRARKRELTPKQIAQDAKAFACGRKVIHMSEAEARAVAERMGHTVYKCSYGDHWHCAHLPGSHRFGRRVA